MKFVDVRKNRKGNVCMWWWNSGIKDEVEKKKEACREMTQNSTEETKNEYRLIEKSCQESSC